MEDLLIGNMSAQTRAENHVNVTNFSDVSVVSTSSDVTSQRPHLFHLSPADVVHTAILLVIFTFSAGSNSLVFAVFARKPSLLNLSNRFVLNLSVCNLLITLLVIPAHIWIITEGHWPLNDISCQVVGGIS